MNLQKAKFKQDVYRDISPVARDLIVANYLPYSHLISNVSAEQDRLELLNIGDLEFDNNFINFDKILGVISERIPE